MDKPKLIDTLRGLINRLELDETNVTDCKVDMEWGRTVKDKRIIPDPKKRKVTISLDLEDK